MVQISSLAWELPHACGAEKKTNKKKTQNKTMTHMLSFIKRKLKKKFFLATPMACKGSEARDQKHTTAATQAAAVTMLDPH